MEDYDTLQTWGLITVEPYESAPRSICSSVIDYDFNTSNPLTPITGLLIIIDYPSPNIAIMECLFDSSLINLSNGVKITGKIHSEKKEGIEVKTTAPIDDNKTESNNSDLKTLAP